MASGSVRRGLRHAPRRPNPAASTSFGFGLLFPLEIPPEIERQTRCPSSLEVGSARRCRAATLDHGRDTSIPTGTVKCSTGPRATASSSPTAARRTCSSTSPMWSAPGSGTCGKARSWHPSSSAASKARSPPAPEAGLTSATGRLRAPCASGRGSRGHRRVTHPYAGQDGARRDAAGQKGQLAFDIPRG
jgi:hypothetical protein